MNAITKRRLTTRSATNENGQEIVMYSYTTTEDNISLRTKSYEFYINGEFDKEITDSDPLDWFDYWETLMLDR